MSESFNKKCEKRVIFPRSEQKRFLDRLAVKSGLAWSKIALEIGINKRTLFDWRREKYSVSLGPLTRMCKLANINFPHGIEIREPFWSVVKAGKIAGAITYKKYGTIGDPEIRRKKWQEWWDKKGKDNLSKWFLARTVNFPKKSEELAEFVGIMMGDGGITEWQIIITLNSETDGEYAGYVSKLIEKLFKIKPSIKKRDSESVLMLKVSRKNLVNYCKSIGLLIGNKIRQNLDIPNWVKENKTYLIACIRGLMDTDGCIFLERHNIKGKQYCYPRLSLVSASPNLRLSVFKALREFRFSAKIRNNRSVQIEKNNEIKKYFAKIGTSNPKHRNKFEKYFGGVG